MSRDEERPRRFRGNAIGGIPIRFLWPNLVTLLALCSGVTAIRFAAEGRYEFAVGAVILAIVLDTLDGRLARYLHGTSRFGAELDSLADFVNFGVAPAVLLYFWTLNSLTSFGWVAALMLVIACALRLARFNVMLEDTARPAWAGRFFHGVPAPAGAGLAMMPVYLGFLDLVPGGKPASYYVAAYVILIAALMISRVPTFSGKSLPRIKRDLVVPVLGAAALTIMCLIVFPWATLTVLCIVYILIIPVGIRTYWRLSREQNATPPAPPQ
ncbi:MAG TPA: phosphatidylcholine/phosphatidylserine synthase [Micropepsaceae bacterium]|nr:phosphatidylcholine/phosphatidylserine synthase [Micropepsaceae bacterium]